MLQWRPIVSFVQLAVNLTNDRYGVQHLLHTPTHHLLWNPQTSQIVLSSSNKLEGSFLCREWMVSKIQRPASLKASIWKIFKQSCAWWSEIELAASVAQASQIHSEVGWLIRVQGEWTEQQYIIVNCDHSSMEFLTVPGVHQGALTVPQSVINLLSFVPNHRIWFHPNELFS